MVIPPTQVRQDSSNANLNPCHGQFYSVHLAVYRTLMKVLHSQLSKGYENRGTLSNFNDIFPFLLQDGAASVSREWWWMPFQC